MMTAMPIPLTCTCGQQQYVASELAGTATACITCGRTLTVPAMGKLVSAPTKPKPARPLSQRSKAPVLLIAIAALAFLGAGGLLAWVIVERNRPAPIAQVVDSDGPKGDRDVSLPPTPRKERTEDRIAPVSIQRKSPEPEKKAPPMPDPAPPVVKEPLIEPTPPIVKEPAKVVVEPVKPKDPVVEKKPIPVIEPLRLVWKLKQEEVFFQELIVTQKPTFKVQGLPVEAFLQYRIVSRFTVTKRNDDGSLVVEQKIESAKLLQADDMTRPSIEPMVAKMPGTVYTMQLSPKMDVTKFEGGAAPKVMQLGGFGGQMTSLVDRDGWKELNQATFFQMNDPPKLNARWSKPLTHAWGSLGSWNGQTHYQYLGKEKDLHKVSYGLQLVYKAPQAGGIGLMTVNSANFQAPTAGGVILFDPARGRVIAAEERFRVKGLINVNLLGQNTGVEIDEDQHFLIRIHDKLDPK